MRPFEYNMILPAAECSTKSPGMPISKKYLDDFHENMESSSKQ